MSHQVPSPETGARAKSTGLHMTTNESSTRHRGIGSLSFRVWLAVVLVFPIMVAVGFGYSAVRTLWTSHNQAVTARQLSLTLDSYLRAEDAVLDEQVPTSAISYAKTYGVPIAQLDSLLRIDFVSQLSSTRKEVNRQSVLTSNHSLEPSFAKLLALRHEIDTGTAPYADVQRVFTQLDIHIQALAQNVVDQMSALASASSSIATRESLRAFSATLTAFTAGNQQSSLLPSLLLQSTEPAQVRQLIEATQKYNSSVQGFPEQLGALARTAWNGMAANPVTSTFNKSVELAITTGLSGGKAPYASDLAKSGTVFRANLTMVRLRTNLALDASSDLRSTTMIQAHSASLALDADLAWLLLVLILAILGVLALNRSVGRPLARMVMASRSVQAGEFDVPPLPVSGPKELSIATRAFNDMSSTLCAVQAHAVALSANSLDDPVLRTPLPGETGRALQETLTTLSESVRENERQRALLAERATHDSLTGLLNRGAALEFLGRDLASVHRQGTSLGVLFIDLDGLKQINDTHGHDAGDAALRAVAQAIEATTRKSDVVARLGGDEFIVGRLGEHNPDGLTQLADRIIRKASGQIATIGDTTVVVGCSIGIAISEPSDMEIDSIIHRADVALYGAKLHGRGRAVWFDADLDGGTAPRGGPSPTSTTVPV
jgi:diguanylate cyclase (GGDEF)-like protein